MLCTGAGHRTLSPRTPWALALLCLAFSCILAGPVHAQADRPVGSGQAHIRGVVLDRTTGQPVSGAQVVLRASIGSAETLTGEDGVFAFISVPLGSYEIEIHRLAYQDLELEVDTDGGRQVMIRAQLVPEALELDPIVVTSFTRDRLEWAGFYDRRQSSTGSFLTRADIEARSAARVSDLFRSIPGFRVVPSTQGFSHTVIGRGNCQPTLYLDGIHMRAMGGGQIDQLVEPDHLEGLEVYSGSQTPAQFQAGRCGTVVAWSHVPSDTTGGAFQWRRVAIVAGAVWATFSLLF